jgi:hypothetical protein
VNPPMVYVVFEPDAPFPITVCRTPELAQIYAATLARLPVGHPMRITNAVVDEVPLLDELPEPLTDPEHAPLPPGFGPEEWTEEPSIDTVEGMRFLLVARCAQARLLVEMLRPHTVDDDELAVLDAVAGACVLLTHVAERRDWSNEDGT